ncbi:hypothetical protein Bpro_1562 [Polaromonas sp. JS666]|nr:hypothetical protein Bpro_1562 [Polaromonas sp. JS666]
MNCGCKKMIIYCHFCSKSIYCPLDAYDNKQGVVGFIEKSRGVWTGNAQDSGLLRQLRAGKSDRTGGSVKYAGGAENQATAFTLGGGRLTGS